MKFLIFLLSASLVHCQDVIDEGINPDPAINKSISDFFNEFEVITQSPLRDLGALTKCGEGEQFERFACVPYYNCDSTTRTVRANPENDGAQKIDIRMRYGEDENYKCSGLLELCCQLGNDTNAANDDTTTTSPPILSTTTSTARPPTRRAFCGIRNSQGIDFNLIEGTNEALFGEFPWMVALLRKNPSPNENIMLCGGSLITPRVVLTGAHCVNKVDVKDITVRVGEWDTQTTNERIPYQERNVVQKIIRYDFIKENLYNDVALLVLDRNLARADNVGTVCLPQQDQILNSRECFATGWGKDVFGRKGRYAVILKKMQLPLVEHSVCERALQRTRLGNRFGLHKSFRCAGGEVGVDTCTGDGGSPLVCPDPNNPGRYVQAGIVAWGIGCGENGIPGVYADVTKFRQWIDTKLRGLNISTVSYE